MDLLHIEVQHTPKGMNKNYGKGEIFEVRETEGHTYITVRFKENDGEFVFPDIFDEDGLLKAVDPKIQRAIEKELEVKKRAETQVKIAKREENEKQRQEKKIKKLRKRFGEDYPFGFVLKDEILDFEEIKVRFHIKKSEPKGKGIYVTTEQSVVLISYVDIDGYNPLYHDHWTEGGDFIYLGAGQSGDQKAKSGSSNRDFLDAIKQKKEIQIHLFVKFSSEGYYYQGVFECIDGKYKNDIGVDGKKRKAFKFRLRKRLKTKTNEI